MPKFYFQLHEIPAGKLIEDNEGMILPDAIAARTEAYESAKELIIDALRTDRKVVGKSFVVIDALGREVLVLSFREVVRAVFGELH